MTSSNYDVDAEESERGGRRTRRRLELCHCRRELLVVKVFYFAIIGSLGVVLTYTSVFLKQHGLSAFEIGVISGVKPIVAFVSAPLWGAVADRYRIRRYLILVTLLAWLAIFVGLYTVGEPQRRTECPESWQPFLHRTKLHGGLPGYGIPTLLELPTADRRAVLSNSSASGNFDAEALSESNQTKDCGNFVTLRSSSIQQSKCPLNESSSGGANYSVLEVEDQELLREDLVWLYEPTSRYRVLIICLVIIVGGEFLQAPTTAMSDAATLQILGRERLHEYGAQLAWGPVGWAVRLFF